MVDPRNLGGQSLGDDVGEEGAEDGVVAQSSGS